MNKTKDQQAQEYVLNRQTARHNAKTEEEATMADFDKTRKVWDAYDMEQAFEDGYTAAEQSMWRSVEEELPEPDTMCLVFGYQDLDFNGNLTRYTAMAWYDGEGFYDAYNDRKYHPVKWMAIPLPDINTENI